MRFGRSSFWLTSLISILCLSITLPASARPIPPPAVTPGPWSLDLGGGWTFSFTGQPSLFLPVESAARSMTRLYELATISATTTAANTDLNRSYNAFISFRIGRFELLFQGDFDSNYSDEWKATIIWPAVATFCRKMQIFTTRGEVLYYNGVIRGPGGGFVVQLNLLS